MESTAKRAKLDVAQVSGTVASSVLHVRGLPDDSTEPELLALAQRFGPVSDVMLMISKGQGFAQYASREDATLALQRATATPGDVRGKTAYFQVSTRQTITKPAATGPTGLANSILHISISNVMYPITVDVLQQILVRFGAPQKIVVFTKQGKVQALVQMANPSTATAALTGLQGQNIYNGCCTLQVVYSNLKELTVRYNDEHSRDFGNPQLPPSPAPAPAQAFAGAPAGGIMPLAASRPGVAFPQQLQPHYNGINLVHNPHQAAAAAVAAISNAGFQHHGAVQPSHGHASFGSAGSKVLLVNNLCEGVTCDQIFTLCGIYGDVMKFNKKSSALVEFASGQQAATCAQYLKDCPFYGQTLHIVPSKHQSVAMPRPDSDPVSLALTSDYSSSPLHRFRSGTKHALHLFPPGPVLHISNIAGGEAAGEEIEIVLKQHCVGGKLAEPLRFFEQDKRMALATFGSKEEAVAALCNCHNTACAAGASAPFNLKLSFAKPRPHQHQ